MNNDTWGIPSHIFLTGYIIAAVVSVGLGFYLAATASAADRVPTRPPRPLTPPQVGMLTGDTHAVAAALGTLRAADLIGPTRRPGPAPADAFTQSVLTAAQRGGYTRLVSRLRVSLGEMRAELTEMGLLSSDPGRVRTLATLPPGIVFLVGLARFASSDGKPVGYLFDVSFALVVAVIVVDRFASTRRLTKAGKAELTRLRGDHRYLAPRMRPAFGTYGAPMAGMSAALFGVGALQLLDPGLASATDLGAGGGSGFSFGGDSGGAGGGGGGGDGGGGGCGGGCGGCGG